MMGKKYVNLLKNRIRLNLSIRIVLAIIKINSNNNNIQKWVELIIRVLPQQL